MGHNRLRALLLAGSAAMVLCSAGGALAQAAPDSSVAFDIPAQPLGAALTQFAQQSNREILFPSEVTRSFRAPAIRGDMPPTQALGALLAGSGLAYRLTPTGSLVVEVVQDPQGASAGDVDALIVTAQKREEAIQDVPIAISAFSQKALEEQKIEGGYDLLKAIPNVTFSKSNFSSYNFSIRGVGTKAISATTDPGVAVAFNNTTLIQNRLFEQEYFDVERVEVLRGPQGTLYGRNATSGVINVISAKPDLGEFEASLKAEIGNYDSRRLVGMVNIPVIEDVLAVRVAGAATQRSGYDYNEITKNNVNGRDLWSGRVTVGFEPTPRLRANLLLEHFEEDDDRSRTGKQLCHRDDGPLFIGGTELEPAGATSALGTHVLRRALFSQGCAPGSLYDDAAFGTPNGLALPFVFGAHIGLGNVGYVGNLNGAKNILRDMRDPYGGKVQSKDLRTISSFRDPAYRADADLYDLTIDVDITDHLSITSQTVYNKDSVYSFQDYNRFNTDPIFTDTSDLTVTSFPPGGGFEIIPSPWRWLAPNGAFCDPQIGCSDRLAGFDISQAQGEQFSQEIRLQSDFDGPLNFSIGANYTEFETVADYYVFYNIISALALTGVFNPTGAQGLCHAITYSWPAITYPVAVTYPGDNPNAACPYVDPTPIDTSVNFDGNGHNYFRSKNPYELESMAAFGEIYWNPTEYIKITLGLRYTDDVKSFTPVPSQILLAPGAIGGGTVSIGYPEKEPIVQSWGEWTGRLGADWKPALPFTDQTMVYAFYSRGYKGGGANPPSPGFASPEEVDAYRQADGFPPSADPQPLLYLTAVEYGATFEPEFVNSFELGAKNTLLDGAMILNAGAFLYDYKDYQVSQIRDRTAVNENFDARIWGVELETVFSPSRDFRINANFGYLHTKIADGESSIDIMNRTQGVLDDEGRPKYVLAKPWAQLPSNCVVPARVAETYLGTTDGVALYWPLCGGLGPSHILGIFGNGISWNPDEYPELNGGAGIKANLGGNELPNAPHFTANIGAQYGRDVLGGAWRVTLRGDGYWQSQSWSRVYNAVNDKLHGWYNLNISARMENQDLGIEAEFYIKNLLDKSPITDAFLNSDDSALTTNVFVLDPRLVGFSLRKTF